MNSLAAWFNWADAALLAVTAAFAILGWRSGLVKMAFRLGSWLAALLLAWFFRPVLAGYLQKTALYQSLVWRLAAKTEQILLPGFLAAPGGGASLAEYAAQTVLYVLSFILVMAAAKAALLVLEKLLHLFASLPVAGFFNRLAGLALGTAEGFLVVCLILAAVFCITPLRENPKLAGQIEQSHAAGVLYRENPVLWMVRPKAPNNGN